MAQISVYPVLPIESLAPRIDASGDCWEWTGHFDSKGYGDFPAKVDGKWRNRKAHRLVWVALCGPVPGNLPLDHLCRVRHCVNPDHLEPVTTKVNNARSPKARAFGTPPAIRVDRQCQECGAGFRMRLSLVKRGEGIVCSVRCAIERSKHVLRGRPRPPRATCQAFAGGDRPSRSVRLCRGEATGDSQRCFRHQGDAPFDARLETKMKPPERPRCYYCQRFVSFEAALKNWKLIQAPGVMDPEPYEIVYCNACAEKD